LKYLKKLEKYLNIFEKKNMKILKNWINFLSDIFKCVQIYVQFRLTHLLSHFFLTFSKNYQIVNSKISEHISDISECSEMVQDILKYVKKLEKYVKKLENYLKKLENYLKKLENYLKKLEKYLKKFEKYLKKLEKYLNIFEKKNMKILKSQISSNLFRCTSNLD